MDTTREQQAEADTNAVREQRQEHWSDHVRLELARDTRLLLCQSRVLCPAHADNGGGDETKEALVCPHTINFMLSIVISVCSSIERVSFS